MATIRIDSILGGESLMTNFAAKDQFNQSLGINPALPIDSVLKGTNSVLQKSSGLLRPAGATKFSSTTIVNPPLWQISNPKDALVYVYDSAGSTYSIDPAGPTVTALSDAGTITNSIGNGCEYYDNYIYFATNTDIVRYGPLNGSPGFQASYWQGTLGKAALIGGTYPQIPFGSTTLRYPNHTFCRHSDGRLYFCDVQGNQGVISYIKTTKTTVEGDTDAGSTASALVFGYGLYPVAIQSYGSSLAIALIETSGVQNHNKNRAKLAFWDTTSTNFNSMLWVEFPDELITAMKNINGVLYIASGNYGQYGCRISRYVGGYSIKEVAYYESAIPPFQGGMDGTASNVIFGSTTDVPEQSGAVHSIGLHKDGVSTGQFKTVRATGTGSSVMITSLGLNHYTSFTQVDPWVGWSDTTTASGTKNGIDRQSDDCSTAIVVWQSQVYKVGGPFDLKRLRIPLAQPLAAGMTLTAKIYFDNKNSSYTFPTINSTNFPNAAETGFALVANMKAPATDSSGNSGHGQNNLMLELRWTGTTLCTVDLPITIDIDVIPD